MLFHDPDTCVYGDLASFYVDKIIETLPLLFADPKLAWPALEKVVRSGMGVKTWAWCYRHKRYCKLKEALLHTAGTPCTAYSAQGARRGKADETIIYFLAWCGHRRALQEATICFENVPGLYELITYMLGDLYHCDKSTDVCPMTPVEFGHAITRPREYYTLRHKLKTSGLHCPFPDFANRFKRVCNWHWSEYFWIHKFSGSGCIDDELDAEVRWAQQRNTCAARHLAPQSGTGRFRAALNDMETQFLMNYRKIADVKATAVQLGQDALEHPMHSRGPLMHCLIKNMGIVYTEGLAIPRWLSASEALVCQGFRAGHPALLDGPFNQCCFQIHNHKRKVTKVGEQAGNAMHVNCVAICLLHALVNVQLSTPAICSASSFFNRLFALAPVSAS